MPKRKSAPAEAQPAAPPRRSTRQRTSPSASTRALAADAPTGRPASKPAGRMPKSRASAVKKTKEEPAPGAAAKKSSDAADEKSPASNKSAAGSEDGGPGRQYWLLKAEPESRFENGVDVKFSIDDLAARTEPEPWDGIRNYVARNNLRAMKKGDLAFFYHSNCKEPGIVGTMEIVQEHSPDLSAHDPKAPYYDPKSSPSDPKWSVVHVKFHSKFPTQIGLKELRAMGGPGKPLENMQMLKQSRLSVSKVSEAEWEYLNGVAEGAKAA